MGNLPRLFYQPLKLIKIRFKKMEITTQLDWILGILAFLIVIGGLFMLFSGVNSMND